MAQDPIDKLLDLLKEYRAPLLVFAGCMVLVLIIGVAWPDSDRSSNEGPCDSGEVTVAAKEHILAQLKAPSTAEVNTHNVRRNDEGVWIYSADVDAENAFGAMLHSRWVVKLKCSAPGQLSVIDSTHD
jgi:hypothetical protein